MHLLVTGGNGFIGRRICQQAVADGHEVTSIARSGEPNSAQTGAWRENVHWRAADVFTPEQYREELSGIDSVVHSIGIISEESDSGVTFERINGDSAIVAALEAERAGVERFVYVSSSTKPPLVDDAYIDARRRAERAITDLDMSVVIPRFGPVYGPDQPHFPPAVNWVFRMLGRFEPIAQRFEEDRPFSVEQAAAGTYELATMADPPDSPVRADTLATLC